MPTLADLETAHVRARDAYRDARTRLDDARRVAVEAIQRHATVHARVVGGAGGDLTAAARERDEAIAALRAIEQELQPGSLR